MPKKSYNNTPLHISLPNTSLPTHPFTLHAIVPENDSVQNHRYRVFILRAKTILYQRDAFNDGEEDPTVMQEVVLRFQVYNLALGSAHNPLEKLTRETKSGRTGKKGGENADANTRAALFAGYCFWGR